MQEIQAAWPTHFHHVMEGAQHHSIREELFWYYLKAFGHSVMSQGAPLLVVVGVLYLPLHIIIIVIITIIFIVNIIFVISIIIRIFITINLLFLRGKLTVWFCSFNFFICLNLIHTTTIWCWRTTSILSFGII